MIYAGVRHRVTKRALHQDERLSKARARRAEDYNKHLGRGVGSLAELMKLNSELEQSQVGLRKSEDRHATSDILLAYWAIGLAAIELLSVLIGMFDPNNK